MLLLQIEERAGCSCQDVVVLPPPNPLPRTSGKRPAQHPRHQMKALNAPQPLRGAILLVGLLTPCSESRCLQRLQLEILRRLTRCLAFPSM